MAAKFRVKRKIDEGALEREKKEREREHLRDRETNGFWNFGFSKRGRKWRGLKFFRDKIVFLIWFTATG